ncbi:MAG TPA: hypothetical protein VGE65_03250 [Sphingobium sp.]
MGDEGILPLAFIQGNMFTNEFWYAPTLDGKPESHRWIKFSKWYEEVIFSFGSRKLTRKNLIHMFRNREGGGHVDPYVRNDDETFYLFRYQGAHTISVGPSQITGPTTPEIEAMFTEGDGIERPVPFGPEASMRQIAWEILESLASKPPSAP